MKKFLFIFLVVGFSIFSGVGLYSKIQHSHVEEAHVYIDRASFPTLLQMVDFLKQDVNAPKIIFWERLRNLKKNKLLKNTIIAKHPIEYNEKTPYLPELDKFVKKYPNAKFNVHINLEDHIMIWNVLKHIPSHRIKEIHFYEDSFARTLWQKNTAMPEEDIDKLLKNYPTTFTKKRNLFSFSIMKFYPSILHIGLAELALKDPDLYPYISRAKEVRDVDFKKIEASLTQKEKQNLLELAGITETDILPFKLGKPVAVFCLGHFILNTGNDKIQIDILKNLVAGNIYHDDLKDYIWAYKEHPVYRDYDFFEDEIKKFGMNIYKLPKTIPLELFFLTGYMPSKILGYSSSLFFAVPKENIFLYIKRRNDLYLPILKNLGKIQDSQVYTIEELKNQVQNNLVK